LNSKFYHLSIQHRFEIELEEKNAEIVDLRAKLECLKFEKENINESLQSLRRDLDEVRSVADIDAANSKQKISALKKALKQLENEQKNEHDSMVHKLSSMNEDNIYMTKEIKKLKEELRSYQENSIRMEERLNIQTEQTEKLTSEVDQLVVQKERLLEASAEANSQIASLKQKEDEVIKLSIKEQDYLAKVK
jgi:chromosome segregation ATPase